MKKEKSVSRLISAPVPAHRIRISPQHTDSDSAHPTTITARQRAGEISDRVLKCDVILHFARTFFQQNDDDNIGNEK
jgi:hypothetical protein